MPKLTPFLEQVVYLVADLLASLDHTKQADKLKKEFELPEWVKKDNPLIKKGLTKILKDYINSNQKILKYYQSRKPESEAQDESQEEVEVPKPTKKSRKSVSPKQSPLTKPKSPKISGAVHEQPRGWMVSQFAQPKRLEDLNDNDDEAPKQAEVVIPKKEKSKKQAKKQTSSEEESEASQQLPKPKKQKKEIKKEKKQAKGPVDTSYLNSEEEFELEDKKTKKQVTHEKQNKQEHIKTRKHSAQIQKIQPKVQQPKTVVKEFKNHTEANHQNNINGPKKFFSRINEEEVGHIPENRRDNTFEAKAKYGVGDTWGQYGYEKLKVTRGDSFKKTKGKLKNKAFQGSGININQINSVPIA